MTPTQHQPRVPGAGDGAHGVLQEADARVEVVVGREQDAADDVGVAVEVLGEAVDDDVSAELDGALKVRRREGVVDREQGADGLASGGDRGDVGDLEQRVGGRLQPDEVGAFGDRGREVGGVEVDEGELVPTGCEHAVEQAPGAAVDVVAADHPGVGWDLLTAQVWHSQLHHRIQDFFQNGAAPHSVP